MTLNAFGKQINIRKEIMAALAIILVVLIGLAGYMIMKSDTAVIIDAQGEAITKTAMTPVGAASSQTSNEIDKNEKDIVTDDIKVYVVGCVNRQGIVTLKKGQLIDDAIRLAGGAAKEADLSSINLVYELKENLMLYVKSKKEVQQPSASTAGSGEAGKGIRIVKDSGGAVVNDNGQEDGATGKVNINKASLSELDTLPGVGLATAKDIIAYRDKSGPFKNTEDIMKVPRIKESRYARIKDFISVD